MAGRPIDEKIVAMKMDISDFAKKASETTNIFGRLKESLNKIPGVDMSKITQSFSSIQSAAQRVDLSSLASNVEKVAGRFSNLSIVAITALTNITNKAVDAGLTLAKSMTIDPIASGFHEYENKMKSIGTMLSNTEWNGSTLDDVKKTLGELNNYADNTIYSFEQMTENIGRFTAAGVTLEDSAIAIKGLGNLAAVSGSDVNQLNTAMYQSSQALASGKLNLEDWNSLVNAGMAGKKTQDALVATAKAMGKNVDLSEGFRNSIQDGWLTSKVFLATLKKFGEDESMTKAATSVRTFTGMMDALKESIGSGWATTFELIFGDFNQATSLWTGLSTAIGGFFKIFDNARNASVKALADNGIFKGIFDVITKGADAVLKIFTAIGNGIKKAFAGTNTGVLEGIGKAIEKFANALTPSEATLKVITTVVQALASVLRVLFELFAGLAKVIVFIVSIPLKLLGLALKGIAIVVGTVATFISKLVIAFIDGVHSGEMLKSSVSGLEKGFSLVGSWIGKAVKGLISFGRGIKRVYKMITTGDIVESGPWGKGSVIIDKLMKIRQAVKTFVSGIKETWDILANGDFTGKGPWGQDTKIVRKLFTIRQAVKTVVSGIVEAWNILIKGDFTGNGPWEEDSVIVAKLFAIRRAVQTFVSAIIEAWNILVKGDFTGVGPWEEDSRIVDALFRIREAVQYLVSAVQEAWNILVKGDFTGVGPWGEESKVVEKLFAIRKAVLTFVAEIVDAWSILTTGELTGKGPWNAESEIVSKLFRIRDGIQKLGQAFKDIGSAISSFWDYLSKSKKDVKGPWDNVKIGNWMESIKGLANDLGDALSNLTGAISQSWSVLSKGVFTEKGPWDKDSTIIAWLYKIRDAGIAVGDYISSLNISLTPIVDGFKSFFKAIATGFNWIKDKVKDVGQAIVDALPDGNKLLAGSFIAALVAIVWKTFKMGQDLIDVFTGWGKIGAGITELLESVGGALDAFSMQVKAQALVTIAIAVGILAASFLIMSRLNGAQIANGLYAIIGSMTALVGAMAIMTKYDITGTGMKAALQIVALSIAFSILAGSLRKVADMKWDEISKGIVGLAGVMGIFAGAIALMSKFGASRVGASALQMVAIGAALHIMISAIEKISKINVGQLKKGVTVIGIVLFELALFMKIAGGSKFGIGSTLGMLAVGRAIMNITNTIKEIAKIDTSNLKIGLKTIGLILAEIAAFSLITGKMGLFSTGLGLLAVSGALTALILPVSIFGNMDTKKLAKGLTAMSIALLAIAGASRLAGGVNLLAMGAGLMLVAGALTLLLVPIGVFASMGWGPMLIGMTGLALSLGIIAGAALLLSPAIPLLTAFGVGLLALGAGMLLAGVAFAAFGAGLLFLATLSASAVTSIIAVLSTLLIGLTSLIPTAVNFMIKLVVQMADALIQYSPILIAKVTTLALELLRGLGLALPQLLSGALDFIIKFVNGMADALEQNGQPLVDAIMRLMGEILIIVIEAGVAVVNALFGWIPGVTGATAKIGKTAEDTIRATFGAGQAGKDKGKDFADGLGSKTGDANTAGTKVGQAGKDGADMANLLATGSKKGQDFASALGAKAMAANTSGVNLANSGKEGAGSVDMTATGGWFGQGFANGISSSKDSVWSAAIGLAKKAKDAVWGFFDINSPSKVMMETGGWVGEGLAIGISDKTKRVADAATEMASTAGNAISGAFRFKGGSPLAKYFNAILEDGDWMNDWVTHLPKVVQKQVMEIGKQFSKTDGVKDSIHQFLNGFELPDKDNELHFKAVVDYDSLDVNKFGKMAPLTVKPDTSLTNSNINATRALSRQNANINASRPVDDGSTKTLLSEIKDNISRIDPNKPVYLVVNDKLVAQSVSKNVIDNYDLKYMKAERGLADA